MAVIIVLVDGVGIAPASVHNALASGLPRLSQRLGGPLVAFDGTAARSPHWHAIDATLGMPGLPQSGTGHTAIWGGFNAAVGNGRHQPSYPTVAMRAQLAERSLFSEARARGKRVAWANAYLPGYEAAVAGRRLRHTAGTWAALKAGLELRGLADLEAGTAVSWDIDQRLARARPRCEHLPIIAPELVGRRLLSLARDHELVAWETYLPDLAGHRRIPHHPTEALLLVDALLSELLDGLGAADTVVVTSDHGNVEDLTTRVHTRNPVPLLAMGVGADALGAVTAIDGIMHAVLEIV